MPQGIGRRSPHSCKLPAGPLRCEDDAVNAAHEIPPEALPRMYASWRRRMLVLALLATVVGLITHGPTGEVRYETSDDEPLPTGIVLGLVAVAICAVGPGIAGTILVAVALGTWRRLRPSNRMARTAWILWVLGPLPVMILPISHIFELVGEDAIITSANQVLYLLTVTAPALFALLPGILTASLLLKRFLPESQAPGQIIRLTAPACIVAYLLPLGILAQLAFDPKLYLGFLLIVSSPAVPLLALRLLVKPSTPRQALRIVKSITLVQASLGAMGATILILWLGEHPQIRAWLDDIDAVWVLGFVARILASKWLTAVVVADVLITMLHQNREAALSLAGTEHGEVLTQKLDALGYSLRTGEKLA